jgi:hypothetical protein
MSVCIVRHTLKGIKMKETSQRVCRDITVTLDISDMTAEEYKEAMEVIDRISSVPEMHRETLTYYPEGSGNAMYEISDEDIEVLKQKGTL